MTRSRGRPLRAETRAIVRYNLRLTPSEAEAIRARLPDGCTMAQFLRSAALGRPIRHSRIAAQRVIAVGELGRVGNNLNQIARALNEARAAGDLAVSTATAEALSQSLDELRAELARLSVDLLEPTR